MMNGYRPLFHRGGALLLSLALIVTTPGVGSLPAYAKEAEQESREGVADIAAASESEGADGGTVSENDVTPAPETAPGEDGEDTGKPQDSQNSQEEEQDQGESEEEPQEPSPEGEAPGEPEDETGAVPGDDAKSEPEESVESKSGNGIVPAYDEPEESETIGEIVDGDTLEFSEYKTAGLTDDQLITALATYKTEGSSQTFPRIRLLYLNRSGEQKKISAGLWKALCEHFPTGEYDAGGTLEVIFEDTGDDDNVTGYESWQFYGPGNKENVSDPLDLNLTAQKSDGEFQVSLQGQITGAQGFAADLTMERDSYLGSFPEGAQLKAAIAEENDGVSLSDSMEWLNGFYETGEDRGRISLSGVENLESGKTYLFCEEESLLIGRGDTLTVPFDGAVSADSCQTADLYPYKDGNKHGSDNNVNVTLTPGESGLTVTAAAEGDAPLEGWIAVRYIQDGQHTTRILRLTVTPADYRYLGSRRVYNGVEYLVLSESEYNGIYPDEWKDFEEYCQSLLDAVYGGAGEDPERFPGILVQFEHTFPSGSEVLNESMSKEFWNALVKHLGTEESETAENCVLRICFGAIPFSEDPEAGLFEQIRGEQTASFGFDAQVQDVSADVAFQITLDQAAESGTAGDGTAANAKVRFSGAPYQAADYGVILYTEQVRKVLGGAEWKEMQRAVTVRKSGGTDVSAAGFWYAAPGEESSGLLLDSLQDLGAEEGFLYLAEENEWTLGYEGKDEDDNTEWKSVICTTEEIDSNLLSGFQFADGNAESVELSYNGDGVAPEDGIPASILQAFAGAGKELSYFWQQDGADCYLLLEIPEKDSVSENYKIGGVTVSKETYGSGAANGYRIEGLPAEAGGVTPAYFTYYKEGILSDWNLWHTEEADSYMQCVLTDEGLVCRRMVTVDPDDPDSRGRIEVDLHRDLHPGEKVPSEEWAALPDGALTYCVTDLYPGTLEEVPMSDEKGELSVGLTLSDYAIDSSLTAERIADALNVWKNTLGTVRFDWINVERLNTAPEKRLLEKETAQAARELLYGETDRQGSLNISFVTTNENGDQTDREEWNFAGYAVPAGDVALALDLGMDGSAISSLQYGADINADYIGLTLWGTAYRDAYTGEAPMLWFFAESGKKMVPFTDAGIRYEKDDDAGQYSLNDLQTLEPGRSYVIGSAEDLTIVKGQQIPCPLTGEGISGQTWYSSDESVVTVDKSGKLQAYSYPAEGQEVLVTVTYTQQGQNRWKAYRILVDAPEVTQLRLSRDTLTLKQWREQTEDGSTVTRNENGSVLLYSVPSGALHGSGVTWEITDVKKTGTTDGESDTSSVVAFASWDENGNIVRNTEKQVSGEDYAGGVELVSVNPGTATLKVTYQPQKWQETEGKWGDDKAKEPLTAECQITVKAPPAEPVWEELDKQDPPKVVLAKNANVTLADAVFAESQKTEWTWQEPELSLKSYVGTGTEGVELAAVYQPEGAEEGAVYNRYLQMDEIEALGLYPSADTIDASNADAKVEIAVDPQIWLGDSWSNLSDYTLVWSAKQGKATIQSGTIPLVKSDQWPSFSLESAKLADHKNKVAVTVQLQHSKTKNKNGDPVTLLGAVTNINVAEGSISDYSVKLTVDGQTFNSKDHNGEADYCISAGEKPEGQLTADGLEEKTADGSVTLTWTSSDKKVATVKNNEIKFTGKTGTVRLTARTVTADKKASRSESLLLHVVTPDVCIGTDKLTINLLQEEPAVQFDLLETHSDLYGDNVEAWKTAWNNGTGRLSGEGAEYLTVERLTNGDELTGEFRIKIANQSGFRSKYSKNGKLSYSNKKLTLTMPYLMKDGKWETKELSFKLTVSDMIPKLKTDWGAKVNSFYTNEEGWGHVWISLDGCEIDDSEEKEENRLKLTDCEYEIKNAEIHDGGADLTIGLIEKTAESDADRKKREGKKKGFLQIPLKGFVDPVKVSFAVSTAKKEPKLVMQSASETLYTGLVGNFRNEAVAEARFMDKNTGATFDLMQEKEAEEGVTTERSKITVSYNKKTITVDTTKAATKEGTLVAGDKYWACLGLVKDGNEYDDRLVFRPNFDNVSKDTKKIKMTLTLQQPNWSKALSTSYTISCSNGKPTLKLSSSKLLLNMDDDVSGTEYAVTALGFKDSMQWQGFGPEDVRITGSDAKAVSLLNDTLLIEPDDMGRLTARFNGNLTKLSENDKKKLAGSYKFKVWVTTGPYSLNTILTVQLYNKAPAVTVSAKGSIDVLRRESTDIVYTPKLANVTGTVTDVRMEGEAAGYFEVFWNGSGAQVKARPDTNFAKGKYKMQLVFGVDNGYQYQEVRTKVMDITVKEGKATVKLTPIWSAWWFGDEHYEAAEGVEPGSLQDAQNQRQQWIEASALCSKEYVQIRKIELLNYRNDFDLSLGDSEGDNFGDAVWDESGYGIWGFQLHRMNSSEAVSKGSYSLKFRVTLRDKLGTTKDKIVTVKLTVK